MGRILQIPTSRKQLVTTWIQSLNGLLDLTDREIEVLAAFIRYSSTGPITAAARKYVAEELEMKSVAVLNNFVKALKDKKALVPDPEHPKKLTYHSVLRSIDSTASITIKFKVEE